MREEKDLAVGLLFGDLSKPECEASHRLWDAAQTGGAAGVAAAPSGQCLPPPPVELRICVCPFLQTVSGYIFIGLPQGTWFHPSKCSLNESSKHPCAQK